MTDFFKNTKIPRKRSGFGTGSLQLARANRCPFNSCETIAATL